MTQAPSAVIQALSEILAAQSPQFAARLKQRLTAALNAKGEPPFDERKLGYKGFRDYLQRGTEEIFSLNSSEDGADVLVSLVGNEASPGNVRKHAPPSAPSIRSDIWQAFTNPDSSRLRYLSRKTFSVRHFLRGEDSSHAREVQDSPGDFVEIEPIGADVQVGWMRQFVQDQEIVSPLRETLLALLAKPYSSGVNAAFTGALGALGMQWRHERVNKVILAIQAWASAHGIPSDKLTHRPESDGVSAANLRESKSSPSSLHKVRDAHSPREQAVRLLDMLSNDDIAKVVVPILLSTLLIRGAN